MKVTFFGTTTLLFDDGKTQILIDGHFTRPRVGRVFLRRMSPNYDLAKALIDEYKINRLKAIFVSHSHYDHILDVPNIANITNSPVYGSLSTINVCKGNNVNSNLIEYKDKESYIVDDYKITVYKSLHSKLRWYNDDHGKEITEPLPFPATTKELHEGGSYDFLIEHNNIKYLIRPSYNYIPNEFNNLTVDYLFQGIGGILTDGDDILEGLFKEINKLNPKLVIPIHHDNMFLSYDSKKRILSKKFINERKNLEAFTSRLDKDNIKYYIQNPLTEYEY